MDDKIINLINEKKFNEAKMLVIKYYFFNKKKYYYYIGLCYCAEKNYDDAIKCFIKAEKHGLVHYLLYYNLATAYMELKKYNEAKKYFIKSIKQNSSYYNNYLNLAYIYIMEKNLKAAYRVIKSATCILNEPNILKIQEIIFKEIYQ